MTGIQSNSPVYNQLFGSEGLGGFSLGDTNFAEPGFPDVISSNAGQPGVPIFRDVPATQVSDRLVNILNAPPAPPVFPFQEFQRVDPTGQLLSAILGGDQFSPSGSTIRPPGC